jgi:hypothetical protein
MRLLIAAALLVTSPVMAVTKFTSLGGSVSQPDFSFVRHATLGDGLITGGQLVAATDFTVVNQSTSDYGLLKTRASASFSNFAAGSAGFAAASATSYASFKDTLIVSSIDPVGTATVKVNLDGLITAVYGGSGSFGDSRAYLNLFATSQDQLSYARYELLTGIGWDYLNNQIALTTQLYEESVLNGGPATGGFTPGASLFGNHDWTFGFDASQPWSVTVTMGCMAYVSDSVDGSNNAVDCDLGHTFTWQGVSFASPGGQPLPGVTVQSLSGQNYSQPYAPLPPVPEPAQWALLIAGFGLAGAVARRRRALAA